MRDAYTLFDQVVSFSGGEIRFSQIQEKFGLVGLEELNALAGACASNDNAGAFAVIDRLMEAGVAIEQFVADLAGYYRSLLLIKAGITRETLLGYSPGRFSAAALEKLSLPQLEEAVFMLLGLYRDLRYSLSPRFELETAVSKLCWLDRWISPQELRAAVESARSALGSAPAASPERDAASRTAGTAVPPRSAAEQPVAGAGPEAGEGSGFMDRPGAFTEGFKQFLAHKTENKAETIPEEAETVRRLFGGAVVK
jgi:DNA polymerase-3 subunit gamma/tau